MNSALLTVFKCKKAGEFCERPYNACNTYPRGIVLLAVIFKIGERVHIREIAHRKKEGIHWFASTVFKCKLEGEFVHIPIIHTTVVPEGIVLLAVILK